MEREANKEKKKANVGEDNELMLIINGTETEIGREVDKECENGSVNGTPGKTSFE